MYEFFSNFYPKNIRKKLFDNFNYFPMKVRRDFVVGSILFFSIGISLAISFQYARILFSTWHPFIALIFMFFVSI